MGKKRTREELESEYNFTGLDGDTLGKILADDGVLSAEDIEKSYRIDFDTPLGRIEAESDGEAISGLLFFRWKSGPSRNERLRSVAEETDEYVKGLSEKRVEFVPATDSAFGRTDGSTYYGGTAVSASGEDPEDFDALQKRPEFRVLRAWLEDYFACCAENVKKSSGKLARPRTALPKLAPKGTDFQKRVWEIISEIPYGETLSYGDIAAMIARERGMAKMSSRAVGSAVGANKITLLIPCHRVIAAGGRLGGYGGMESRKAALLMGEGVELPE